MNSTQMTLMKLIDTILLNRSSRSVQFGPTKGWLVISVLFLLAIPLAVAVSADGPLTLTGTVVDAEGPVVGATVRVALTDNATTSAADGVFRLTGVKATGPLTVTAWAEGYYIGTVKLAADAPEIAAGHAIRIELKRHFIGDNSGYTWFNYEGVTGSAACAECHTQNPEWEADAHSQSAKNPRFLSLYTGADIAGNQGTRTQFDLGVPVARDPDKPYYGPGYQLDYPDRNGNCATCHTPLASKIPNNSNCGWSGCHTSVTAERMPDFVPPAPSPVYLAGVATEGISCEFCHKIGDVYLNDEGLPLPDMPGILSYRLYRPHENDHQLFFGPFDDVDGEDTYLPLQSESAFCAPCHYGVFGGVVGVGHVAGGTLIYNSYGEWLDSPYSDPETGQTCQDCHMPLADYEYFVYPEQGGQPRPGQLNVHTMPGAADEELLRNAVTMTTTAALRGNRVVVDVSVTNDKTGHHVPTDSPLRHVMLVVTATDAAGRPLSLRSGPLLPAWTGDYAGQPGRTYAKVLRDDWTGEQPTAAYWRPVTIVADTRLAAYATDRSRYTFDLPPGAAGGQVTARLVFRRAYQELMQQKGWTDPDIVMAESVVRVGK